MNKYNFKCCIGQADEYHQNLFRVKTNPYRVFCPYCGEEIKDKNEKESNT